jgi:hypothetical protein
MSESENDLDNTLASETKEAPVKHAGKSQASASDPFIAALVEGMRAMSKDENLRKKIGIQLV